MKTDILTNKDNENLNSLPQRKPKKVLLFATIILLLILGSFLAFLFKKNNTQTFVNKTQKSFEIFPTPTPMPFAELTIPYLREKEYKSALDDIQISYEDQSYSAYITSYDSDGLNIYGLLTQPKSPMPKGGWPAIIFIHGYTPPAQYQTTTQYTDYVDYLAKSGFVVFKIDLRGHGNSEGEPGGAYYSSDYIIDVLNAYSALQNSSFLNPQKIGLWGHSMAGNIVMRSLAVKPVIPAGVIWAGAVYSYADSREYGINDNSYQPPQISSDRVRKRQKLFDTHGQFNKDNIFWQQVAPTNYLNDLKSAIQIHHAIDDNVVDIRYSRNLNNMLNQTSVIHQLHEYSNGGHNLTGSSFTEAMERTVNFFKENL